MKLEDLPRPISHVLGGRGSRGALQVGMLQALSEHDIAPDVVIGTSVGALNGALVALDHGACKRHRCTACECCDSRHLPIRRTLGIAPLRWWRSGERSHAARFDDGGSLSDRARLLPSWMSPRPTGVSCRDPAVDLDVI